MDKSENPSAVQSLQYTDIVRAFAGRSTSNSRATRNAVRREADAMCQRCVSARGRSIDRSIVPGRDSPFTPTHRSIDRTPGDSYTPLVVTRRSPPPIDRSIVPPRSRSRDAPRTACAARPTDGSRARARGRRVAGNHITPAAPGRQSGTPP